MKKLIYFLAIVLIIPSAGKAQNLESVEYIGTTTSFVLSVVSGLPIDYDVEMYKLVYTTVDANGNPTIASGAFMKPVTDACTDFPLAVYQHGTVLNKENVPSRDNGEAILPKILAGGGFYALTTDYIGMGDSPGLHPYMHAESEATAAIDMMRAVRQYLNDSLGVEDNGQVFISGYSQGGHGAMALHKYIEDNNMLDEFDVIMSAPASGPYDMSGTQMELILSNEPYSNPGYLVYVLSSYQLAYGNLYNDYSDVLQSPYDTIVVPFFNGTNTTLTMADLNPLLPQQVQDLMTPEYYAALVADENHPLRLDLIDNDNYNWVPEKPITMYYCTEDEQVTFQNTLTALEYMTINGATNVTSVNGGPFSHGDCVLPSMTGVYNLFQSMSTGCSVTGIKENQIIARIYPNPATSQLNIILNQTIDRYELLNALGQVIVLENINGYSNHIIINIEELEKGMYFLRLYNGNSFELSKSIIKM